MSFEGYRSPTNEGFDVPRLADQVGKDLLQEYFLKMGLS